MSARLRTELQRIERRLEQRERRRQPVPFVDAAAWAVSTGVVLDDWQRAALTSASDRQLWLCGRQTGKSSTAARLALWTALSQPPALVLLLARALRQSQEGFRKVLDAYNATGGRCPAEAESALRLELTNGSRIIALPGKEDTIRSYSGVSLLVIDEASRVPDPLYYAVRPMLAVSGGRLVCLSTPWGKRGFFYQEWTEGGPRWERTKITAAQCLRIPRSFLEEERATMPERLYRQEYGCSFEDTEDAVFSSEDIEAAMSHDVEPLFPLHNGMVEPTPERVLVRA
jgi:hypothetical protein